MSPFKMHNCIREGNCRGVDVTKIYTCMKWSKKKILKTKQKYYSAWCTLTIPALRPEAEAIWRPA